VPDPLDTLARAAARLDGEDDGLQLVADWLRSRPRDLIEHLAARAAISSSISPAEAAAVSRLRWHKEWPTETRHCAQRGDSNGPTCRRAKAHGCSKRRCEDMPGGGVASRTTCAEQSAS
jgi:hypothetical protein